MHGPGSDEPLVCYNGGDDCTAAGGAAGAKFWLHADARGSVIALSDTSGTVVAKNTYDPYGEPGPTNTGLFQYTGQIWLTETGLYHYKARAYHSGLGRFLQTDPIGYGDGMNMYAYAGNDPVNGRDPSGECVWGVAIGIAAEAISIAADRRSGRSVSLRQGAARIGAGALIGGLTCGAGGVAAKAVGKLALRAVESVITKALANGVISGLGNLSLSAADGLIMGDTSGISPSSDFGLGFAAGIFGTGVAEGIESLFRSSSDFAHLGVPIGQFLSNLAGAVITTAPGLIRNSRRKQNTPRTPRTRVIIEDILTFDPELYARGFYDGLGIALRDLTIRGIDFTRGGGSLIGPRTNVVIIGG